MYKSEKTENYHLNLHHKRWRCWIKWSEVRKAISFSWKQFHPLLVSNWAERSAWSSTAASDTCQAGWFEHAHLGLWVGFPGTTTHMPHRNCKRLNWFDLYHYEIQSLTGEITRTKAAGGEKNRYMMACLENCHIDCMYCQAATSGDNNDYDDRKGGSPVSGDGSNTGLSPKRLLLMSHVKLFWLVHNNIVLFKML